MILFFSLFLLISLVNINVMEASNINTNKYILNESEMIYYNYLFDSLEYDDYNLSLIYNNHYYNTIKIKHKRNSYTKFKDICIFGVLCNDKGFEIENVMLNWLLPDYDVYCVYQKYPGILYEYPALRFAQWFSLIYNKTYILYVHTKGAFHPSERQNLIRDLWKHEFTYPRKKIYIQLLKDNYADISLPFRSGICTWFNGMFISNRAFNLIDEIISTPKSRWHYESLFKHSNKTLKNIRFKGVLNDSISGLLVLIESYKLMK